MVIFNSKLFAQQRVDSPNAGFAVVCWGSVRNKTNQFNHFKQALATHRNAKVIVARVPEIPGMRSGRPVYTGTSIVSCKQGRVKACHHSKPTIAGWWFEPL